MSNIWSDNFKEIRDPYFDIEDPYITIEEKKNSKDWDGDGKVESGAKEYRGIVHNAIQKKKGLKQDGKDTSNVSEEIYTKKNDKIDGKPGAVKNKINVNPTVSESRGRKLAASAMFNCLTNEEIYEAVTTSPMGDAQTEYSDSLAVAKAKAAKAKVAKELADLKLAQQSQRTKTQTNESVVNYLKNRYNV